MNDYYLVFINVYNKPVIDKIKLSEEPGIGDKFLFYDSHPELDFTEVVAKVSKGYLKDIDCQEFLKVTKMKKLDDNGIMITSRKVMKKAPDSGLEVTLVMLENPTPDPNRIPVLDLI